MHYLFSLILAILANTIASLAANSTQVSQSLETTERCQCYVVSGPDPGYFQNYKFYDFRSLGPNDGRKDIPKRSPSTEDSPAEELLQPRKPASPEKVPLTGGDWDSQAWRRAGSRLFPVPIENSPRNVFISQDEVAETEGATYLTMRTMRQQDFSSTAEIVSRMKNLLHASIRIRLRLFSGTGRPHPSLTSQVNNTANTNITTTALQSPRPPPPGAVAGVFTYHSFTSESDIEILTSDPPHQVRYVNQPSYDPVAGIAFPEAGTTVPNVPVPWTEWSTHRLDWFPKISRWYVNGIETATKTYGVPFDPSMLVINLWSDGGIWSGNLTVGEAVHLGIEWIEIAYNTSGPVGGPPNGKARGEVDDKFKLNTEPLNPQKRNDPHEDEDDDEHEHSTATKRNACMVGCLLDDPDDDSSAAKNLGIPRVAWDNRPTSEGNGKRESLRFEPIVIPNPLIESSEMQSDGGWSVRGGCVQVSWGIVLMAGVVVAVGGSFWGMG
ncbi:hypothetical protein FQN54_009938 [Arachnomyces sp. PD_36]|nr:hypothetical protein FQN54_009938 [Arachnomyces sp. PD_36]